MPVTPIDRDSQGRFTPGNPGGPGRPKGPTPASQFRELLGKERIERLVEKAFELADGGDVGALRLCLERLFPVHDARGQELLERMEQLEAALSERRSA
jgi:hypothetical protein